MNYFDIVEATGNMLFSNLVLSSPVMSGNMQNSIKVGVVGQGSMELVISAPFYDIPRWRKDKTIVHTGEKRGSVTDYAEDVNKYGGFRTHNESEGWVNRTIKATVDAIAAAIGPNCEVIWRLGK